MYRKQCCGTRSGQKIYFYLQKSFFFSGYKKDTFTPFRLGNKVTQNCFQGKIWRKRVKYSPNNELMFYSFLNLLFRFFKKI